MRNAWMTAAAGLMALAGCSQGGSQPSGGNAQQQQAAIPTENGTSGPVMENTAAGAPETLGQQLNELENPGTGSSNASGNASDNSSDSSTNRM